MTTRARPLVSPTLIARGFGGRGGSDFEVYTSAAVADEGTELPVVRMVGSSTVKDLQGDIMTINALQDMAAGNPELTIFLNHEYNVPDDVFGKLHGRPEIRMAGSVADLHLAAVADLSRDEPGRYPRSKAYDTYTQIKKGRIRLGSSVGCQVTEYQFLDPDDFWSGILIEHVVWVEHSIVGVPASQRAWVEQAVKGLFERALLEGRAEDARLLAPAVKSMFWRDYDTVLRYLESDGLRKDLERVKERGAPSGRIIFNFDRKKGFEGFAFADSAESLKPITPDEIEVLLLLEKELPKERTSTIDEEDELAMTKAVSGKTSWPLMEIGTEWTGSKAEKQIFSWAENADGEIAASKAKQCFLYNDPDNNEKHSGYKMPFCYVDGSPKIVPLGVRACAGVLSGGMGGVHASDSDKSGMKSKVKTMYGRINSQFHPDPPWQVPWEREEKSEESKALDLDTVLINGVTYAYSHETNSFLPWVSRDGVLDSTTGEDLIRQDLGEQPTSEDKNKGAVPRADDVAVGNDGTHPLCRGTHTHIHPANGGPDEDGDGRHSHSHSHDGDAQHSHSHAEKHTHPHTQKAIETDEDGNHRPFTGQHTHAHKAFGADDAGKDGQHSHEHEHDGDTVHKHPHKEEKSFDPIRLAKLSLFNTLGMELGFPQHTFTTKCDLVPTQGDAGIVRSTLSALDDCSDAMIELAQRTDSYVDALMGMMAVPDTNDYDEDETVPSDTGPVSNPFPGMYHFHPMHVKEGREISGKNAAIHQQIHNLLHSLHPDGALCKNGPAADQLSGDGTSHQDGSLTVSEAQEEARQMGQGDSYSNLASFVGDTLKASLAKALEGVSAKALIEQSVSGAVDAAMQDTRANLERLEREQTALMGNLAKLANMPLGRPTNLQRTITPVSNRAIDNVATYEEMLGVAGITGPKPTLQEALSQTSIVEKEITSYGQLVKSRFRHWPATVGGSVGEGVRPPLTSTQKTLMHWNDWDAYNSGNMVDVPVIDDPAERL